MSTGMSSQKLKDRTMGHEQNNATAAQDVSFSEINTNDSFKDLFRGSSDQKNAPNEQPWPTPWVFLGFSPFLGFHTVLGVAIAFLFRLNRVAVLLGVWSNTPWWIVPYYIAATGLGLWMTGLQIDRGIFGCTLQLAKDQGIIGSDFWGHLIPRGFFSPSRSDHPPGGRPRFGRVSFLPEMDKILPVAQEITQAVDLALTHLPLGLKNRKR
jgi:hypothetical protein